MEKGYRFPLNQPGLCLILARRPRETPDEGRLQLDTLAHWLGPLHPPLTHFPIVCSILAFLALAVGAWGNKDWLLKSAGALWILVFISGVASLLAGHLFAHHLGMATEWSFLPPHEVMKGQLRWHALLGTLGLAASLFTLGGVPRLQIGRAHV